MFWFVDHRNENMNRLQVLLSRSLFFLSFQELEEVLGSFGGKGHQAV